MSLTNPQATSTAPTPPLDRARAIAELAGLDVLIDVARQDLYRHEARAAQKALHLASMVTLGRGVMLRPDTRTAWGDWVIAATDAESAHDKVQQLHARMQDLREVIETTEPAQEPAEQES